MSGHFHAVRFYKDAQSLCGLVSGFLAEGFDDLQPAVVVARPEHRTAILEQLRWRGVDPGCLQECGQLVLLDAEETLARFMVDGVPDATRFRNTVGPVLDAIGAITSVRPIRAYGEMVDILWRAGQTVAAIRLEMLWNDLAQSHEFSLLCGYAMGNFYKDAAIEEICSRHTHVMSPAGEAARIN